MIRFMLYFAYGSNMDPRQMRRRCPSNRFVGIARLPDYRLDFTRRSQRRRCGTADVVPTLKAEVWGIIYNVPHPYDVTVLDAAEGYDAARRHANAYWRIKETVILEPDQSNTREVELYVARRQKNPPPPSRAYMGHLIRGAQYWGLPATYIEGLERIPVDPDRLS